MGIATRYAGIVRAAGQVIARRGYREAPMRDIARSAGLSLAGLYHYVGGKEEVLFLALDGALERLHASLDAALAGEVSAERRLLALVRTHLEFALRDPAGLKLINRDWERLGGSRRRDVAAKRTRYLARAADLLAGLDGHGRTSRELRAASNLLLGMLNGIATRPFLRTDADPRALAPLVTALFLHGFLAGMPEGTAR